MEFTKWLDRLAWLLQCGREMPAADALIYIEMSVSAWRAMYDDGLSPEEAYNADYEAGARCAH